jgi:hypothetical protein
VWWDAMWFGTSKHEKTKQNKNNQPSLIDSFSPLILTPKLMGLKYLVALHTCKD